jgi:hypothetical protein
MTTDQKLTQLSERINVEAAEAETGERTGPKSGKSKAARA